MYLILGIAAIADHYIFTPATIILSLGIVFLAGGIAGILAAWQGKTHYYQPWIEILPPIVAGLLIIWLFPLLFMLPLAIAVVLTGLVMGILPARRDVGCALMTLGCTGSAILAYNTSSLLTTGLLVGGAIWMGGETYRHR